jgi:hypothetical protein
MSDDRTMADLLGEAPGAPDPGFRFDVFARIAERARRRAALHRVAKHAAAFAGLGLAVPVVEALGLTWADAQPLALTAGIVALAYFAAALAILGPRPLLARSRALLRVGA